MDRSTDPASQTLPGSVGERELQTQFGTTARADRFYELQMLDHLNSEMIEFIARLDMMFVATADSGGACDCSIRCGLAGFVHALNDRALIYPEYRGNGVMASLGNIAENPNVGLLMVDFFDDCVGLHINGSATIVSNEQLIQQANLPERVREELAVRGGRAPERWVHVAVHEAYIHCSKHIPKLAKLPKKISWGTDDPAKKGGDYFQIRANDPGVTP